MHWAEGDGREEDPSIGKQSIESFILGSSRGNFLLALQLLKAIGPSVMS